MSAIKPIWDEERAWEERIDVKVNMVMSSDMMIMPVLGRSIMRSLSDSVLKQREVRESSGDFVGFEDPVSVPQNSLKLP